MLIMSLAKVIVAVAWADGEVSHEEINALKDLLFRIPALKAHEWAELDIYIETPVGAEERARLIEDLRRQVRSKQDRDLVFQTLDELTVADGAVTEAERAVIQEIKDNIGSKEFGLSGALSQIIGGAVNRRAQAAPNREKYLDEFIKNKVYYGVRRRLEKDAASLGLADDRLWKLSLAGGLMGYVAHVDETITDSEFAMIVQELENIWDLSREEATLVAEVATDSTMTTVDYFRFTREFQKLCSYDELVAFLDVLFSVAAADGLATREEIEQIRLVARSLLITHEDFIQAKLKLPANRRGA